MKVDFIQLDTIPSTNTWAKDNASRFNPAHLTCITAKEQTSGRGRQEKKWVSPKNANLYATLFFVIPQNAPYTSNLGQIMALSCTELLSEFDAPAQIKWPNDLLIHKKKIGGILTETFPYKNSIAVALGLGLNINMPETILDSIDQPATSLHLILQKQIEPSSLLQPLLNLFIPYLLKLQQEGFAPFRQRFLELLAYRGLPITVHLPQKNIQGILDTITLEGCLRLRLSSGDYITLSTGEIL